MLWAKEKQAFLHTQEADNRVGGLSRDEGKKATRGRKARRFLQGWREKGTEGDTKN